MTADAESAPRIEVRCPAKVNLFLEVLGRREDGYHEIETVLQAISIFDEIAIETPPGLPAGAVEFTCDVPGLAPPGENLVERAAARFLRETAVSRGVRIALRKRIPHGSGLGGGSSDAAAVLVALDRLLGTRLGDERLESMAASIGSDCPFFVRGGAAVARGRGERLERLSLPHRGFLVVVPPISVSTKAVYESLARGLQRPSTIHRIPIVDLKAAEASSAAAATFNRLEDVAFALHPELRRIRDRAAAAGVESLRLTGSGGGFFALFESLEEADVQRSRLIRSLPGEAWRVFAATSVSSSSSD